MLVGAIAMMDRDGCSTKGGVGKGAKRICGRMSENNSIRIGDLSVLRLFLKHVVSSACLILHLLFPEG